VVKIKYIIIALLIAGIGIYAAVHFFQSEEKKVMKQFNLLSEYVSKDPDEKMIAMATRMQKLGGLFDEQCELMLAVESLSGNYAREEISSAVARGRSRFSRLSLRFFDPEIVFPEKGVAKVNLTARLRGQSAVGENMNETRELECALKKIDKKWLFRRMEVVEVLKK
jgi:hypothetical protein